MADLESIANLIGYCDPIIEAYGTCTLPPGMTQEEADRLIREADEAQALKESQS